MSFDSYTYFETVFPDGTDLVLSGLPDNFEIITRCSKKRQAAVENGRQKRYRPRRSHFQSPPHKRKFCDSESPIPPMKVPQDSFFLSTPKRTISPSKRPFWQKKKPHESCFVVKSREMKMFFKLTEDDVVHQFLTTDSCYRVADKYLLAMVFAYFKRANFSLWEYTRFNFFIALYLANDVEEDEEEIKYEIFPWAIGKKWKDKYSHFLKKRDKLLRLIDYKAIVSRRCSDEIMAIEPDHPLWKRERPIHHAGAIRNYMKDPEEDGYPRGPDLSPRYCHQCDAHDSQYDSASPASVSWCISSGETSPEIDNVMSDDLFRTTDGIHSTFDMKGLQNTLPTQEEVFPFDEE